MSGAIGPRDGAAPGARYVELSGAGHLAHLEAAEAFTTAVGSFLAEARGDAPAP